MQDEAKSNISKFNKAKLAMGRGPEPKETPSEIDWQIKSLVSFQFESDENPYDCDNIVKKENANYSSKDSIIYYFKGNKFEWK